MDTAKAKLNSSVAACADGDGGFANPSRYSSILLVIILLSETGILLFKASTRPFWYDEIITSNMSALQPFSTLLKALQTGADGMTPGYYLMVQMARMLPLDPHVGIRVPSVFGYIVTLLGIYWFARKRLPAFAGLAAVILVTLSPFRDTARDARCYTLLVGFLTLSAVCWQRIGEKRFMTPLFALFLILTVSCHYLSVVLISAFVVAELTWSAISRRIRWGVWAGCVLATVPFFLSLPTLLHFRQVYAQNNWSRPSWGNAF